MATRPQPRPPTQPNSLQAAVGPRSHWSAALTEIDKHRDVWVAQLAPMRQAKSIVEKEMLFTDPNLFYIPLDNFFFGELCDAHKQLVDRVTKLLTDGHMAMTDIALLLGNTRNVYQWNEDRNKQLMAPTRPWAE